MDDSKVDDDVELEVLESTSEALQRHLAPPSPNLLSPGTTGASTSKQSMIPSPPRTPKSPLEVAKSRIIKLESSLRAMMIERNDLMATTVRLQRENKGLQHSKDSLVAILSKSDKSSLHLLDRLKAAERRAEEDEELLRRIQSLELKVRDSERIIRDKESALKDMEETLRGAMDVAEKFEIERVAAVERAGDLEKRLDDASKNMDIMIKRKEGTISQLKKDMERVISDRDRIRNQLKLKEEDHDGKIALAMRMDVSLHAELDIVRSEKQYLEEQVGGNMAFIASLESRLAMMDQSNEDISALKKRRESDVEKITALQRLLEEADSERAELQASSTSRDRAHQNLLLKAQSEIDGLQSAVDDLKAELLNVETKSRTSNARSERTITTLEAEIASLNSQLRAIQSPTPDGKLEGQISFLEKECERLQRENINLRERAVSDSEKIVSLEARVCELTGDVEELKTILANDEQTITELRDSITLSGVDGPFSKSWADEQTLDQLMHRTSPPPLDRSLTLVDLTSPPSFVEKSEKSVQVTEFAPALASNLDVRRFEVLESLCKKLENENANLIRSTDLEVERLNLKVTALESLCKTLTLEKDAALKKEVIAKAEAAFAGSEVQSAKFKISALLVEREQLKAAVSRAFVTTESLLVERDAVVRENSTLYSERDAALTDCESLASTLQEVKADNEEARAEAESLRERIRDLSTRFKGLLKTRKSEELELESRRLDEIRLLTARAREREAELEILSQNLEAAVESSASIARRLEDKTHESESQLVELTQLHDGLDCLWMNLNGCEENFASLQRPLKEQSTHQQIVTETILYRRLKETELLLTTLLHDEEVLTTLPVSEYPLLQLTERLAKLASRIEGKMKEWDTMLSRNRAFLEETDGALEHLRTSLVAVAGELGTMTDGRPDLSKAYRDLNFFPLMLITTGLYLLFLL